MLALDDNNAQQTTTSGKSSMQPIQTLQYVANRKAFVMHIVNYSNIRKLQNFIEEIMKQDDEQVRMSTLSEEAEQIIDTMISIKFGAIYANWRKTSHDKFFSILYQAFPQTESGGLVAGSMEERIKQVPFKYFDTDTTLVQKYYDSIKIIYDSIEQTPETTKIFFEKVVKAMAKGFRDKNKTFQELMEEGGYPLTLDAFRTKLLKANTKLAELASLNNRLHRANPTSHFVNTRNASRPTNPSRTISICQGCGRKGHMKDKCELKGHPDYNAEDKPWAESTKGKAWQDKDANIITLPPFKTLTDSTWSPPPSWPGWKRINQHDNTNNKAERPYYKNKKRSFTTMQRGRPH